MNKYDNVQNFKAALQPSTTKPQPELDPSAQFFRMKLRSSKNIVIPPAEEDPVQVSRASSHHDPLANAQDALAMMEAEEAGDDDDELEDEDGEEEEEEGEEEEDADDNELRRAQSSFPASRVAPTGTQPIMFKRQSSRTLKEKATQHEAAYKSRMQRARQDNFAKHRQK